MLNWLRKWLVKPPTLADLRMEAFEDAMITEWEFHRMNEEMLLPNDPPYWPDENWGTDGHFQHSHYVPPTCDPRRMLRDDR